MAAVPVFCLEAAMRGRWYHFSESLSPEGPQMEDPCWRDMRGLRMAFGIGEVMVFCAEWHGR